MTFGGFWTLLLGAGIGALLMTSLMAGARMLGLSRMSIPFMLGTMVTANRDRAVPYGLALHVVFAMLWAVPYYGIFFTFETATWWLGAIIGLGHGLVTLLLVMPALPGLHPRMASERDGPSPTRALEPPGSLGLNYGRRTPAVALVAHVIYGVALGAFCQVGH